MEIQITTRGDPPVSVESFKLHLSMNDDGVDELLEEWLQAAVEIIGEASGFVATPTTFTAILSEWPTNNEFVLPRRPLQAVNEITFRDKDSNEYDLTGTAGIDGVTGRIKLDVALKPGTWNVGDQIRVVFSAGDTCPARLKTIIRLLAAHFYQNREAFTDVTLNDVPVGLQYVIQQLRGGAI